MSASAPSAGGNTGAHLRFFVETLERLEGEKKELVDEIREVYEEVKSNGFDVKALRAIIRLRKQDKAKREAFEAIVEEYIRALGLIE